ncbi:release factor glutamine methyltransferase [Andreprevotia lacus DSM 23236]|jgi:release factor glutamine methyltransferase|uniref:Release factor glutamine methyltransferase n=1 Tax=Andreprevotia lacus DSM 23236 TaxID=1121001 RepID=A0A1W1XT17_9NEIS|nr:peptide chain release factor N(5)-glutamine methyltransferase [Andreprevotia lacus]SMC27109.1 release factor glutamine methyltransferase [Andreprevotia lacus DSM 23236]
MPDYQTLLAQSGLERIDAQVLFSHVSGRNRAWLIAHGQDEADAAIAAAFDTLAARRRAGEPVAYLVGQREFFGRDFKVSPAVLIPRPDTELLVELALARAGQGAQLVDLGTGSGCIPVTIKLERPDLQVSAVDISPTALVVATANAAVLGAEVRFRQSDWFAALAGQRFDVIVSNPPYIEQHDAHLAQGDLRFEPRNALTDEGDGLVHIRSIVAGAPAYLLPQGWLLFEHGYDQGEASRALLAAAGFAQVQTWADLAGLDRVSGGQWQG